MQYRKKEILVAFLHNQNILVVSHQRAEFYQVRLQESVHRCIMGVFLVIPAHHNPIRVLYGGSVMGYVLAATGRETYLFCRPGSGWR